MKVKKLIKKLMKMDQELDVWVADEVEGNDSPLRCVEIGKTQIDSCDKNLVAKDIVICRW
jgi:hypothetical protein